MKHELLIPSGDMESLHQAIANGADAVYVGCKNFSARKFATNFTNEELISAIRLCHLYGVKIYVTMNTLVKDTEVEEFLSQIEFLYQNGIDAILIQDFGMICLLREMYPELTIHASTQTNTSSEETAELFYKLGVKRVVFAREMTLAEIEKIKVPIETEVFIHGALCVCYSGCCLMSSMLGNRSGNRGECAGSCRLPYSLEKDGHLLEKDRYLLSMKELNTSTKIKDLLNSNITSFKIEGRMKSPEYVGFITRFYRNLIDSKGSQEDLKKQTDMLRTIYNRKFTLGHLANTPVDQLINKESPNHIGLEIGRVIEVTKDKIKIQLKKELNQQDGIRFLHSGKGFIVNYLYDEHNNLINTANKICYVDNKINLTENDIVCKTQDYKLMNELKKIPSKKIPVTLQIIAYKGKRLEVIISDGNHKIRKQGNIVEASKNAPVDEKRIQTQMEKLGDTPFISTKTIVQKDKKIFIPIKELNELRRSLTSQLIEVRMESTRKIKKVNPQKIMIPSSKTPLRSASVYNKEQLQVCLNQNLDRIYVEQEALYDQYKGNPKVYYKLPRCIRTPMHYMKPKSMISDYLDFKKTKDMVGDYGLNIMNIYTAYYLQKQGLKEMTLSVELTPHEIEELVNNYQKTFHTSPPPFEFLVYGRIENMIIKGNLLNLQKNNNYYLIDQKNRRFPIYFDGINTHILNHEVRDLEEIKNLKKYLSIRMDFYDEDKKAIQRIVNKYE